MRHNNISSQHINLFCVVVLKVSHKRKNLLVKMNNCNKKVLSEIVDLVLYTTKSREF